MKTLIAIVILEIIGQLAMGCGSKRDEGIKAAPSVQATPDEETVAFDESRAFFGADAVKPNVVYTEAVACRSGGTICCDPNCEGGLKYGEGQSCWRAETNTVHLALTTDPLCSPMYFKLQAEMCNAVAWQNGVFVDQWSEPCAQR